jgi:hypothetical protein
MKREGSWHLLGPGMHPLGNENIIDEVTKYLGLTELCAWKRVSKLTEKSFRTFFFGVGGFRKRVMDFIRENFTVSVTQEIEKFQNATGALITGSAVLKILANEPWDIKDLDIIVPLNEKSIDAFATLVRACVPKKDRDVWTDDEEEDEVVDDDEDFSGTAHVTKFDSLRFPSFQPPDNAASYAQNLTENEKKQQETDRANFKKLTAKFSAIKDMCENFGYNKHVRAVYFAIDSFIGASDKMMDVVFVPEEDLNNCGGLINWMKYNFDFQICANAILPKSAYCMAPLEISNRSAFLRLDQYCCDVKRVPPKFTPDISDPLGRYIYLTTEEMMLTKGIEFKSEVRWQNQFDEMYGCCNCERIAPKRLEKYEKRGYKVESGTCAQYKEWRKNNEVNAKY